MTFEEFDASDVSETVTLAPTARNALSKGARAGIVLGTAAVLLFFLWLFVCCMVRKSRRREGSAGDSAANFDMKKALLKAAI